MTTEPVALAPVRPLPPVELEVQILSGTAFLDVAGIAPRIGVSEKTVREMAASGELPARKTPGGYRFHLPTVVRKWFGKQG